MRNPRVYFGILSSLVLAGCPALLSLSAYADDAALQVEADALHRLDEMRTECRPPENLNGKDAHEFYNRCIEKIEASQKQIQETALNGVAVTQNAVIQAGKAAEAAKNSITHAEGAEEVNKAYAAAAEQRKARKEAHQRTSKFLLDRSKEIKQIAEFVEGEANQARLKSEPTAAGLGQFAGQLNNIEKTYKDVAGRFAESAASNQQEAVEFKAKADQAEKNAEQLASVGAGSQPAPEGGGSNVAGYAAIAGAGVQGLGLLSKMSNQNSPSDTPPNVASKTGSSVADIQKGITATEKDLSLIPGDARDHLVTNDLKNFSGIGEYSTGSGSTISSSSASVAPTPGRRPLRSRGRAFAAVPGKGSAPASAAADGKQVVASTANSSNPEDGVVEYDSAGGGGRSDLSLATSLGGEDLDLDAMMKKMLGIEDEPNPAGNGVNGGNDYRSIASENSPASMDLPAGVLSKDSGTLFDRVREANARLIKSGRVLNGLNSKI